MRKPTEAEILRLALEPDLELEYEMTLRMTDEQIRANLLARGHDLRVLEAEADIHWNMFRAKKSRAGVIAGSIGMMTAAAATIVATLGPAVNTVAPIVAVAAAPAPVTPAQKLRDEALQACDQHAWQACIAKLDEAKALDPVGDRDVPISEARERATRELWKGTQP